MLGDVAVMVHPEDERYAHLIGKIVTLPLTDREIRSSPTTTSTANSAPASSRSRPRTTSTTTQVGQRHNLAPIEILTLDAKINDNAPSNIAAWTASTRARRSSPISKRRACSSR
jgi:valyl-tRNA synthetase